MGWVNSGWVNSEDAMLALAEQLAARAWTTWSIRFGLCRAIFRDVRGKIGT